CPRRPTRFPYPPLFRSLSHGERLLVDKITYRFRPPARGEIVVFRYPADPSRKFIKRVIGQPGDVVYIRGGRVFVNGTPLVEDYILGPTYGEFRSEEHTSEL